MQAIYYVIVENRPIPPIFLNVMQILNVFACDLEDIDSIYKHHVAPLIHPGVRRNISVLIFAREPSMFGKMAQPYIPQPPEVKEPTREEQEQVRMDSYKQHEAWEI